MRLIDADALVNMVEAARKKARTLTGMDFVMVTKDRPTIYAIPVEWLRQEAMKDDGLINSVIRGLLMKWQKEQEANK